MQIAIGKVPAHIADRRQHSKSPYPRQHGGSHPEGDYISQRVQFAAKVAGCVSQTGDAPIQAICYDGHANGFGGKIKMPVLWLAPLEVRSQPLAAQKRLHDCVVAGAYVQRCEERRQQVHAFPHPSPAKRTLLVFPSPARLERHGATSKYCCSDAIAFRGDTNSAKIDAPPFTWSPTLILIVLLAGKITSVREPNLIIPTRSP